MSPYVDSDVPEPEPNERQVNWRDVVCAWLMAAGVVLLVLVY